jgi:hypothetical protein
MRTLTLLLALGPVALAQGVTGTVTPHPAYLGSIVTDRFCNNSGGPISLPSSAPWTIRDLAMNLVYAPIGLPVIQTLQNGVCRSYAWNQRDQNGQQVPPSTYLFEVRWFDALMQPQTTQTCFVVTDTQIALCAANPFPVGCPIRMRLSSPPAPTLQYFAGCSLASAPGIPVGFCQEIPLVIDPLFLLSLCGPPPVFNGFCGILDGSGLASAYLLPPATPALVGFSFWTAFATITWGSGRVYSISEAVQITLGPVGACPCP